MAVYSVEGKLGTGKTKFCVRQAQVALRQGRRVASNVDLYVDKLLPEKPRSYIRLPDKPTSFDLDAMGHGNPESYDEEKNGVLILDELGTWLNSRAFQDKSRSGIIDWLIHARKLGWDVYLIVQDANMIDRQVREALIEYQCRCMRLDKVRVPIIGGLLCDVGALIGLPRLGMLPRMHLVTARIGEGPNKVIAQRWMYRGDDLHVAYDTRQCFSPNYPHGVHSVLPPWEYARPLGWLARLLAPKPRPAVALKPKHPDVERLMRLPAHRRLAWIKRLEIAS